MKTYAPTVIEALGECLRTVYWFKPDLKSFFVRAGLEPALVNSLPWDRYKRDVVRVLLDDLASEPATGKRILERLIDAIVEQDEKFAHLARLDDGKRKVADARAAVRRLKDLLGTETVADRAERARQEKRTETQRATAQVKMRQQDLQRLNERFMDLWQSKEVQRRGYEFQVILRDLFALYDLDPRGAFARPGEQTDGRASPSVARSSWSKRGGRRS